MNSCILMAEIVQEPQLRYTSDNMALAEMLVQFPALRADDPPATLKVVGWGNLAQEIQQNYHQGDRVILEGRLGMSTVERPEGFKEKRAELTVQRIHGIGTGNSLSSSAPVSKEFVASRTPETAVPSNGSSLGAATPAASTVGVPRYDLEEEPMPQASRDAINRVSTERTAYPVVANQEQDIDDDDIPF